MFPFQELPYKPNALEPVLSEEQVSEHYDKHHRKYYQNLKNLIDGTQLEDQPLVEIIRQTRNPIVFNNAAQVYNHNVWWESLSPDETEMPVNVVQAIEGVYGSVDEFRDQFMTRAQRHFGSGWAWLVKAGNEVEWWTLHDADTPVKRDGDIVPLLTVDLWEHAFYIDYKSDKKTYLEEVYKILNWTRVDRELSHAQL